MKKPTKQKLPFTTTTVRPLQNDQLAHVQGGSLSIQPVIKISGPSVISYNPSGG